MTYPRLQLAADETQITTAAIQSHGETELRLSDGEFYEMNLDLCTGHHSLNESTSTENSAVEWEIRRWV